MHYCIVQDKNLFHASDPVKGTQCPYCKSLQFKKDGILGMELPDGARDGKRIPCPFLGKANMLMTFSAKDIYFESQPGFLSIKSAVGGEEIYDTGKERFAVKDDNFLILPNGMSYSSEISSKSDVESFCVFFGKSFVEDVYRNLTLPVKKLLEAPVDDPGRSVELKPRFYRSQEKLKYLFQNLKAAVKIPGIINRDIFEELMLDMLESIIKNQVNLPDMETRLDKIAAPLHFETLRRLLVAKEYIEENLTRDVYLSEIADIAYFSPFHFLRIFKEVFGMPPRQYIIDKRLTMAKRLLNNTRKPINEIAVETGFKTPNYFSRIFRKCMGLTPREFREIGS